MGKDAKKAAVSDEWRSKDVEERLSYSLIKVRCSTVSSTSTVGSGREQTLTFVLWSTLNQSVYLMPILLQIHKTA